MWHPICRQFMNRAEVSRFSVMAPELFSSWVPSQPLQSRTSKCRCSKGKKNPVRNKYHMDQCKATEITSSSETMVCPSEILRVGQSCCGFTGRPLALPLPGGVTGLSHSGTAALAVLRLPQDGSLFLTETVLLVRRWVSAG